MQLFGIAGSKQSTRRCLKEGCLLCADLSNHTIYRDVGRHCLSHLKFNWAGPIPFIFSTNSSFKFHSILDVASTLWKKRTDPVCSMLAHNWIFGKSDASGSAGIEPAAGNRCGKEGLRV